MNKKGQPNLPRIAGIAIAIVITLLIIGVIVGGEGLPPNGNGNGSEVSPECDYYEFCFITQQVSAGATFLGNMVGL